MKRLYLFTLEIVPLEVGRMYDELPSHLTLMSRFLSELLPDEITKAVQSAIGHTPAVPLTFGNTEKLGPKQVTAHMVTSPAEQQLHMAIKAVLDRLNAEYQYPDFISAGHKAHVTAREGISFTPGSTHISDAVYLIEVVNKQRIVRAKLPLKNAENMAIGLKRGTVQIKDYNPAWAEAFEQEKDLLMKTLGSKVVQIEHIGSTSVPGLPAKPVIDMIAAVESLSDVQSFIVPLQQLGYEYMPQRMFPDRRFFPKGPAAHRTHHLNFVLKDDPEQWHQPILFREYLKAHPEVRTAYARLKEELAAAHPNDRTMYTQSKGDFITEIIRKATKGD